METPISNQCPSSWFQKYAYWNFILRTYIFNKNNNILSKPVFKRGKFLFNNLKILLLIWIWLHFWKIQTNIFKWKVIACQGKKNFLFSYLKTLAVLTITLTTALTITFFKSRNEFNYRNWFLTFLRHDLILLQYLHTVSSTICRNFFKKAKCK